MPNYLRFDLGLEHRFKIFKLQPWIGVRAYNAFNAFLPADVQANISVAGLRIAFITPSSGNTDFRCASSADRAQ